MSVTVNINLVSPVCTPEKWAELIGKDVKTVARSMNAGKTEFIQFEKGGERLVNVMHYAVQAAVQSGASMSALKKQGFVS